MAAAAVLYVKDLRRMRDFYESCFEMSALASEAEGEDFCVLESDEWELSLVSVPKAVAATLIVTDPPRRREDSPVKLVFSVASIEALRSKVVEAGGQLDPNESAWQFRGSRHLDCLDPEGNVVQLRERLSGG